MKKLKRGDLVGVRERDSDAWYAAKLKEVVSEEGRTEYVAKVLGWNRTYSFRQCKKLSEL